MAGEEEFSLSDKERTKFVPAMVARSREEAELYLQLFIDHDIPARIGDGELDEGGEVCRRLAHRSGLTRGVPVLVSLERLDEANEIIADREDLDEFQVESEEVQDEEDEEFGFVDDPGTNASEPLGEDEDDEEEDLYFDDSDEDEEV